ncbi:MAG: hypothetical protein R2764_07070 [Bacteroidales bacterium]
MVSTDGKPGMAAMDAFTARIKVAGESADVNVFGGKGFRSQPLNFLFEGIDFTIGFGPKIIKLPFAHRFEVIFQPETISGLPIALQAMPVKSLLWTHQMIW